MKKLIIILARKLFHFLQFTWCQSVALKVGGENAKYSRVVCHGFIYELFRVSLSLYTELHRGIH